MFGRQRRARPGELFILEGAKRQPVKGESHYQGALSKICGGKTQDGHNLDVVAELRPEPTNNFDPNAVAVLISGRQVGYLPKEQAAKLQSKIHQLSSTQKRGIGCRAQVVGGWDRGPHEQGHFGVNLFFDPKKIP